MIFTIFKKELKETLRDKRTLIMMLVIPLLIFPLILNVVVGISSSFEESAESKTIKIGVIGETEDYFSQKLKSIPNALGPKELIAYHGDSLKIRNDLKNEKLDLIFIYDVDFSNKLKNIISTVTGLNGVKVMSITTKLLGIVCRTWTNFLENIKY